ncbi:hypothetical protein ABZZ44_20515 [Streptomyces sp. NPDC006460]|uniref:hypothetical protein n=1 Tax=Streptomyces sp. NPDC006460 TaxID=3154304 RepID=UPI0033ACA242
MTGGSVRRGQRAWLVLVSAAAIVLTVLGGAQVSDPIDLVPSVAEAAAVPGVLALAQYLLLRSGRIEPGTIGVAGLSAAIVGVNSAEGDGRMLLGVLLACAAALPFALLSGYLALNAGLGYAMVSAATVLIAADQLVLQVVDRTVNTSAPLLRTLGGADLWLPSVFLVAAALFGLVALLRPTSEPMPLTEGWLRPTLLIFLPAFGLSVLAGVLYTARIQAAIPGGLSRDLLTVCLLGLAAGGCSLRTGEAHLVDVAVGALFAGSLTTFLAIESVDAATASLVVAATAVVFVLLDLARSSPAPAPDPAPVPDPR